MKSLLAAAARFLRLLSELDARTALRPVTVPVRFGDPHGAYK
jgi:hypothetical protein